MPSFDVVSEIDQHELTNAIDQANREISNRFDFKGTNSRIEKSDAVLKLIAPTEFQVGQVKDILHAKLAKRNIDVRSLQEGEVTERNNVSQLDVTVQEGIDKELAKRITKLIKDTKIKVQASIQGDQVRVTGKKRDDLQELISLLKSEKSIQLPLQFNNFRD
ncbi:MAG: YajQ family cyclic di-GMP-binding protein [Gammaproteobacteria bacterium]|nr:YajQ family cyclic di-GMP-binding protein [Gammaproteobacteria bacterium]